MKNFIKIFAVLIIVVLVALPVEHWYGDNIYAFFVFSKSNVIQIDKNMYKAPKDHPEAMYEYMESNGWEFVEQEGNTHFFEKDNRQALCTPDFKEFYAQWEVTYQ